MNPFVTVFQPSGSAADLVIAKVSHDMSALLFSSFLGSTASLGGGVFSALTVDTTDHPIVVGTTAAMDFPTTPNSYQPASPASKNSLAFRGNTFISKLDLATPAPSVCLAPLALDFGVINVGASTSLNLNITNCGNATLQISSVSSTSSSFVPGRGCTSIAVGSTCSLPVTFTAADTTPLFATLTLTDNAAIPQQTVGLSGQGGNPLVYFPSTFAVYDLFVGTQAEIYLYLANVGDANWIVTNVTATGDFTADNRCTSPVPAGARCNIGVIFAPKLAGQRTGTLSIFDNEAGSPHTVQLTGNGLSTYPVPGITSILAVPMDARYPQLQIFGANFFPTSQVLVNGAARTSTYLYEEYLTANLTASDLSQPGELQVSIVNPSPGGGTSNTATATIYAAIRNVDILHSVYDPKSALLYGSVSTTSANYQNQIVVIDPAAAKVTNSWSVGNGPNQIAVSDDGQFLYVGLDGDQKVA